MIPNGPAGPVNENQADHNCERKPEAFEVVEVQMVVPKGWGEHFAGRLTQALALANAALCVKHYIEDLDEYQWKHAQLEADVAADHFALGEWVEIEDDPYNNLIDGPQRFVKGTKGQIIGIRWGWDTPYLVAIPTPVDTINDGTWDNDRGWVGYYYDWHHLRRLEIEEIPEKYRATARTTAQPRRLPQAQTQIAHDIMSEILAEERERPKESPGRRNARLRRERVT